jgi:LPPG:FO 2-phospho-L-lactate transferase
MHFQEYLVRRSTRDKVLDVKFFGVETAQPAPGVIDAITESEIIIVCPSNPIVSIGTILSLKGVRESLRRSKAHKVAVSPIVGGAPIKGPADKMMSALGLEVSSYSIAKLYSDFLDTFVLDVVDEKEKNRVEELGINVIVTNTVMRNFEDKIRLAKTILDEIRKMI